MPVASAQAVEGVDLDHVSVCMITHNEEEFLEPCLRSLQRHFGHVAILDMGSVDRTAQVARDVVGPRLSLTDWPRRNLFERGFAAARNAATLLADRPWAFHVDADELLVLDVPAGRIALKDGSSSSRPAWKVGRRNLIGLAPESLSTETLAAYEAASLEQHVRLFRRDPGVEWIGFLHEEIFVEGERSALGAPEADVSLDHVSHFKSLESRILKESFYAWMLLHAYFTPDIRAGMQPEYIAHTERMWDYLYPIGKEFGAREGLTCDWNVSGR